MRALKMLTWIDLICLTVLIGLYPIWSAWGMVENRLAHPLAHVVVIVMASMFVLVFSLPLSITWVVLCVRWLLRRPDSSAKQLDVVPPNPPMRLRDAGHRWLG